MYSLVEWTDEQKYSVVPLSRIKEPRKAYEDYKIGDVVRASCPGFSGVHNAKLIAIRRSTTEDKKALERLAIEHVESLDQLKDTSASAARPLEEPRNICSTSESQRNLSKDKPEKRKKKSTSNVSPKKAKGHENKENREELKEQRQKKKEEQQKQKEIQLKKNKAFLSSLDAFKDMVSNNSTAAVEEGERTFVNLDNQQIMPVSSASLYQAPEHSTHQDTSNSSSCQTWTPQQTSQQNCTPQQTSQQSWVPQLASQQTCTPQQSSQQSWAPQQSSQQIYTPQQSSQQSWAPQQASLQIWTPQQHSQQNWIPQSIQNQTRALQPTINPNWTTQPTPNWTTQTSSDWSQMTQHTSDQNWTQDSSQSQHSVLDQDNRDLSAAPDPASTKVPKEKENSVRRQIFPADKTAVNQACQKDVRPLKKN